MTEGGKNMKESKTFKGVASVDGDDGYCFGVHFQFLKGNIHDSEVIDYLDELGEKYHGKKIKIKIEVELVTR